MDFINSADFGKHVEDLLGRRHVPGISIAVFNQKDVSCTAFGFATLEPPSPATPDTMYDMASTSKSLTAAAVGKLISNYKSQDKITWTTPMSKLLPEDFVLPDEYASQNATVEDILSHRTGMPGHDMAYMGVKSATPDTPRSVTRSLRNLPATAPFRTKYQYNNGMFTVATHLVEEMSQTTFAQFLQSNVFDVLGMSSTYLQPSAVKGAGQMDRLATRYVWKKDTASFAALEPVEQPEGQGAGSLQSTVKDYAKWLQAMMKKDETLFEKEIYEELIKPRIICDPEADESDLEPFTSNELYALGWSTRYYRGHKIVEHSGGISGFTSIMLFMPQHDFGLVILANADGGYPIEYILSMEIIDHVLNVPVPDHIDWVSRRQKKDDDEDDDETILDRLRKEQCPSGPRPLQKDRDAYTGVYENAGYGKIVVDIENGRLHIDGSERSEPFTTFFEHVCEDTKFVATEYNDEGEAFHLKSEFRISPTGEVTAVGISFCQDMGDELIWFEKETATSGKRQGNE